ncbi:MAG: hypothetical protein EOP04_03120 [Proteobacteria bacterium]|nr:MAG: hypothetical protein EOP04_03120 [Pseudomonadota bacterium]
MMHLFKADGVDLTPGDTNAITSAFPDGTGWIIATDSRPYWAIDEVSPVLISAFANLGKTVVQFEESGWSDQSRLPDRLGNVQTRSYRGAEDDNKLHEVRINPPNICIFPMIRNREIAEAALTFARVGIAFCGFHVASSAFIDERLLDLGISRADFADLPTLFIERVKTS